MQPMIETFYVWKVLGSIDGEEPRLFTPWGDPMEHEFPMDWQFPTVEQAKEIKQEYAPEETWILCKCTIEPLEVVDAEVI